MGPKYVESTRLCARLLGDARPFWGHLLLLLLLTLSAAPIVLLAPVPLQLAVDTVLAGKPLAPWLQAFAPVAWQTPGTVLVVAACLSLALLVLQSIQSYAVWVYQIYTGERLVLWHRVRLFWHAQRLSLRHHDEKGAADLQYRLMTHVYNMHYLAIYGLIPMAGSILTFGVMSLVTARLDWQLALMAVGVVPLLGLISRFQAPHSRRRWASHKAANSAVAVLQETLSCIRVVKAFAAEEKEACRYRSRASLTLRCQMAALLTETAFGLLVSTVVALASAAALYVGVCHVQTGVLSLGGLLVVVAYLAQLFKPLESLGKQVASVQAALASADRVYQLTDAVPDIQEPSQPRRLRQAQGRIELHHVSFAYHTERPVIDDVSLVIQPGERVGIVGVTGAGKSTLIQLLVRLYDPSAGRITLDGVDLRDLALTDLRRQFALVLQEPVPFSGTLADNIAYGVPDATHEDIIAAAEAAQAHEFISQLPNGYLTEVGERGVGLSGGERQRISIARAFLMNAAVLVLDEPTSAVDDASAEAIAAALTRLQQGRTTITISHRMALLDHYDRILCLENGRLTPSWRPIAAWRQPFGRVYGPRPLN